MEEINIKFGGKLAIITAKIHDDYVISIVDKDMLDTQVNGELWSADFVKSLEDDCFAAIYSKGSVKYRRYPHHTKGCKNGLSNNDVCIVHLRSSMERINSSTNVPRDNLAKAKTHLQKHADALLK